jgi:hypothetical protein
MGLDLTLLVSEGARVRGWDFAHTVIDCERRSALFDAILNVEEAEGQAVLEQFNTYVSREGGRDVHYGNTQETPYGEPVRTLPAGALVDRFADHEGVTDNPKNRAAWAYLREREPSLPIALYWH